MNKKEKKTHKIKGGWGDYLGHVLSSILYLMAVSMLILSYKYLLITYHVTGVILDAGCTMMSSVDLWNLLYSRETVSKQTKKFLPIITLWNSQILLSVRITQDLGANTVEVLPHLLQGAWDSVFISFPGDSNSYQSLRITHLVV